MQPDHSPRPGSASHGHQRSASHLTPAHDLAGASFTARDSTHIDYVSALQRAAEQLNCSPFRTELMYRIEEASQPLPPSLEKDVALAKTRFDTMSPESQLKTFQKVFDPVIMVRAAWAIPGCPFIGIATPTIPLDAQEFMKGQIADILASGILSPHTSLNSITALGMSIPRYKKELVRHLMFVTGFGAVGVAACGAPLGAAVILGAGALLLTNLTRRPDFHGEFAAGCLLESMDADKVLRGRSDTVPTLSDAFKSYFESPVTTDRYPYTLQSEGFLAARILRIFGHSAVDIVSGFSAPHSLSPQYSPIINLVRTYLESQDVSLDKSLTEAFRNPSESTNGDAVALLETVNRAHFTWAFRDKQKLRHDVATLILRGPENEESTPA